MIGFACLSICAPAQAASPLPVPTINVPAASECKNDEKFIMDGAWIHVSQMTVNSHEVRVTVSIGKFVGDLRFPDSGQMIALRRGAFFVQYDSGPKIVTDLVPQSSKPFSLIFLDLPSGEHQLTVGLIGGNKLSGEVYETHVLAFPENPRGIPSFQ